MKEHDYIIIGAGASGLAMTSLLAKAGKHPLCLEAHSLPGGCAGYFDRGPFSFDVGATTLSGFAFNGPLEVFLAEIKPSIELQKIDPGLIICLENGIKLHRYSHLSDWVEEQNKYFDEAWMKDLWKKIEYVSDLAWKNVDASQALSPKNIRAVNSLLFHNFKDKLSLFRPLTSTFENYFLKNLNIPQEYLRLVNEQLLISSQSFAHQVPAMIGAMSLSYPQDTWYVKGGMRKLWSSVIEKINAFDGEVKFRQKIIKIEIINNRFIVHTKNETYYCNKLISSIPTINLQRLLNSEKSIKLDKASIACKEGWGAIAGYYKLKLKTPESNLYHQVHSHLPYACFLSLCPADDLLRTSDGYQTLTICTHVKIEDFHKGDLGFKDEWAKNFNSLIRHYFKDNLSELVEVGIGDPKTFEKFTGRYEGRVGGIPHTMSRNLLNYPKYDTGIKNLFAIGDTTFPGQGIVGVVKGASNLFNQGGFSEI